MASAQFVYDLELGWPSRGEVKEVLDGGINGIVFVQLRNEENTYQSIYILELYDDAYFIHNLFEFHRFGTAFLHDEQIYLLMHGDTYSKCAVLGAESGNTQDIFNIDIPVNAFIYNSIIVNDQLIITYNDSGLVKVAALNLEGDLLEEQTMPGFTLQFLQKNTFSKLLDDGRVLTVLHCDRVLLYDPEDIGSLEWIEPDIDNCFIHDLMSPFEGSNTAYTATYSIPLEFGETDNYAIVMMLYNQDAEYVGNYSFELDYHLFQGDLLSTDTGYLMSVNCQDTIGQNSPSDYGIIYFNSSGELLSVYRHYTEFNERAPRIFKNDSGIYLYSSHLNSQSGLEEPYMVRLENDALSAPDVPKSDSQLIKCFSRNGMIQVQNLTNEQLDLSVYNPVGQLIQSRTLNPNEIRWIKAENPLLILKANTGDRFQTEKLLVR